MASTIKKPWALAPMALCLLRARQAWVQAPKVKEIKREIYRKRLHIVKN